MHRTITAPYSQTRYHHRTPQRQAQTLKAPFGTYAVTASDWLNHTANRLTTEPQQIRDTQQVREAEAQKPEACFRGGNQALARRAEQG